MHNINSEFEDWKNLSTSPQLSPTADCLSSVSLTSSNDFLFAYVAGVDFSGKLQDGYVGVLVCMWIHVGLQRLQLLCEKENGVC